MEKILYIVIGAILAFLSSWIIEGYKNKKRDRENERTTALLIKQELFSISRDLEKLKNALEYKNYFEIKIINFLEEKVKGLNQYKKDLTHLPKLKDRETLIELISNMISFLFDIRILENIYLENVDKINKDKESEKEKRLNENSTFFNQKRLEKLVTLVEIQRRVEEVYKKYE